MRSHLDPFDRKILAALQADSRITTLDLADRVGLSQAPCWRRVRRLREAGYIRGEVALLDPALLGLGLRVFVLVRLISHARADVDAFSREVLKWPEVVECHVTLGATDCLLTALVPDMEAYEALFLRRLAGAPNVRDTTSLVSMSQVKSTTELPLP
jgi:Lrp/AsnC family transcriptional regulator